MIDNADELALDPGNESEIHGVLCGMLCVGFLEGKAWLSRMMAEQYAGLRPEDWDVLLELFAATVAQLADSELGFSLRLPGDEAPLAERAAALGLWCQGFLFGLALRGLQNSLISPEVREFVNDIAHIAQVDFAAGAADEAEERAYAELLEYVRMGVLLVYQELRPAAEQARLH